MATRLVDVAAVADISARRGKRVVVDGEEIVLWMAGDSVVAALNLCPHQHIAALHQGTVENGVVTCPMHGWTFVIATGHATNGTGRLTLIPAHIKGGRVWVELHDGQGEN